MVSSSTSRTGDCEQWLSDPSPTWSDQDREQLQRACRFLSQHYGNRARTTGDTYKEHAQAVTRLLGSLHLDPQTLVAALLHDCPEAAPEAAELIETEFGQETARLVKGLEKMSHVEALGGNRHSEGLRKLFLSIEEDVRAVLIKLAERTHDLRVLKHLDDPVERRKIARETMDLYAPLANRLGIGQIKWELEDLSFRFIEPAIYKRIAKLLDERRIDREEFIGAVTARLRSALAEAGVQAEVYGRPKHIYSIWNKMIRKDVDFDQIYDVRALRVMVDSLPQCYAALGIVHSLWAPIPGEFDDYIAKPKNNLYQSLHTAVYGPSGKVIEVQIRTHEMHHHAELGGAAHWRYKEGGPGDRDFEQRIQALRQALDLGEHADPEEFLVRLKDILHYDTIHVFTPKGTVIDLPRGSTALDFAYHIHTDIGNRCRGAKVNGTIVPLTQPLENGQQVEVLTIRSGRPSRDWLNPALGYLHTARARSKARQWFKQENFSANVEAGNAILQREFKRLAVTDADVGIETLVKRFNFQQLDDFFAALGRGDITVDQVVRSLHGLLRPPPPPRPASQRAPQNDAIHVKVQGLGNLVTHLAKCCNPAPGDPIIAVTTHSQGVKIHRRDCPTLAGRPIERLLDADWSIDARDTWRAVIAISARDRQGLLRDISGLVSSQGLDIVVVTTESRPKTQQAEVRFTVEVHNLDQMSRLLGQLEALPGVKSAVRVPSAR
jgi:GTP pyrophosphokinase